MQMGHWAFYRPAPDARLRPSLSIDICSSKGATCSVRAHDPRRPARAHMPPPRSAGTPLADLRVSCRDVVVVRDYRGCARGGSRPPHRILYAREWAADLILVRTDTSRLAPLNHPYALVYTAHQALCSDPFTRDR